MCLVELFLRTDSRYGQGVLRQRTGLVGAQDIHRGRLIHRGKPGGQDTELCQGPGAERRGKGKRGRQRNGNRCQDRCKDEGNDLGKWHLEKIGIGHQERDDHAIEHGEVAHHTKHRLLLGTHNVGGADEFGGAAELGAHTGCRDLGDRLAAPHQRTCEGLHARGGFNRHRLAGEHGLVEKDLSGSQAHVRGNHATEGKLHHITRHQIGRGHGLPRAVAPHRCVQGEPRLQRSQGCLGTAFLKQSKCRIEYQETGDDRRLDILSEGQLQDDRGLEHPRNGRPELAQRSLQGAVGRVRRCVRTDLPQPLPRLVARQAAWQIILRHSW